MDLTPALILSMWTAGSAAAAAVVAGWQIVKHGYVRLAAGVVVLFGAAAAGAGGGAAAWVGVGIAAVAIFLASSPRIVIWLLSACAFFLALAAFEDSPVLPALTGGLFLGLITAEMMLGHWYLVDPQLPRWALQALAIGAGAALVADVAYLSAEGVFSWGTGDEVLGWAFIALTVLSALLITGVSLALREPAYTAVMASTGLSYLAVLTSFGVVVLGRLLAF